MRRMLILVAVLFFSAATFAQAPEQTVTWSTSVSALKDGLLEVRFTGKILDGWHTYRGDKYYVEDGIIQRGQIKIDGEEYYFSEENKELAIEKWNEYFGKCVKDEDF